MGQAAGSLGPVFVAGFAVQQFLEVLTSILGLDSNASFEKYKKAILGVASFGAGLILAINIEEVRVLKAFGITSGFDIWITGFVLSAGTEGANSILKFLKYSKEDKKSDAAAKDSTGAGAAPGILTAAALQQMNRK
jgi:hypothetical protein